MEVLIYFLSKLRWYGYFQESSTNQKLQITSVALYSIFEVFLCG
jgi:hypothetical protein